MDFLKHIGTKRHSGRYPWGSGDNPQRSKSFRSYVNELKDQGLSEAQIAEGMKISVAKLRSRITAEKAEEFIEKAALAIKLKEKGYSNLAIAKRMGISDHTVKDLLDPHMKEKAELLGNISNMLQKNVNEKGIIDVGAGVEVGLGISRTKLNAAVSLAEDAGYTIHHVKVRDPSSGNYTLMKVLCPPGTELTDAIKNRGDIRYIEEYSEDGGRSFLGIKPPTYISSNRVLIRYREDGGSDKDGVIELRRNVDDLSLNGKHYAQVRVGVDGTHFMKGMAMYADNMPDGYDIIYNTNKPKSTPKGDVFKKIKDDPDNPFGATLHPKYGQKTFIGKDGKEYLSPLNVIAEEGSWTEWQKSLSSQVLSKQLPSLAKKQLDLVYNLKKEEYDEIMSLTNPVVKAALLKEFSDECDSDAVHLKGAALPRQASHIILPITSLKENQVYAPNYNDGEVLVLIRHPHGGKFEIPELIVNNKNKEAKSLLGNSVDAIGINPKVAQRLSGADFDGDTVLAIPNNSGHIKTSPALKALQDFDTKLSYPDPKTPNFVPMDKRQTQLQMGIVSNLITDMTIKGANFDEIARAVKHSMVVIDAEKHTLDYKRSYLEQDIEGLKLKYQGKVQGGASTIISRAKSPEYKPHRKEGTETESGTRIYIDPKTGKKLYQPTGQTYTKQVPNKKGPYYLDAKGKKVYTEKIWVKKPRVTISTKMAETDDARKLSSGTTMENIYADHANKLKALGNQARLSMINTPHQKYNPSARETYKTEIDSLESKLRVAFGNKPLERRARLLANKTISAKYKSDPLMQDKDKAKKIKGQAITEARARVKAKKQNILITDKEWEAIQAGAISHNTLKNILQNTDSALLKQRATPHYPKGMSTARIMRAKSLLAIGHTQTEIAEALGVSVNTLVNAISEG